MSPLSNISFTINLAHTCTCVEKSSLMGFKIAWMFSRLDLFFMLLVFFHNQSVGLWTIICLHGLSTHCSHLLLAEAPPGIWYDHCLLLSIWEIYIHIHSSSSDFSTWLKVLADFFDTVLVKILPCYLISSIANKACADCNK